MSAISVAGIGGLGLVAMAVVIAWVMPGGRLLLALGAAGGAIIALSIVLFRRSGRQAGPSGDHPQVLFQAESLNAATPARDRATAPQDLEQLLAVR